MPYVTSVLYTVHTAAGIISYSQSYERKYDRIMIDFIIKTSLTNVPRASTDVDIYGVDMLRMSKVNDKGEGRYIKFMMNRWTMPGRE